MHNLVQSNYPDPGPSPESTRTRPGLSPDQERIMYNVYKFKNKLCDYIATKCNDRENKVQRTIEYYRNNPDYDTPVILALYRAQNPDMFDYKYNIGTSVWVNSGEVTIDIDFDNYLVLCIKSIVRGKKIKRFTINVVYHVFDPD